MGIVPLNDSMFANVYVRNPALEANSYISYAVLVETNNPSFSLRKSITHRRYSEFVTLRETLVRQCPAVKPPDLPSKSPFKNNLKPDFIEKRRQALESFLVKLVQTTVYLSNKTFHLFLQSSYSMNEIKDIVEGRINEYQSISFENLPERFYDLYLDDSLGTEITRGTSKDVDVQHSDSTTVDHITSDYEFPCDHFVGSVNSDQHLTTAVNSSSGRKRVSFCDNVIVAQVHG